MLKSEAKLSEMSYDILLQNLPNMFFLTCLGNAHSFLSRCSDKN